MKVTEDRRIVSCPVRMSSITYRTLCNREQEGVLSTQEDPRTRFIEDYREEVEE